MVGNKDRDPKDQTFDQQKGGTGGGADKEQKQMPFPEKKPPFPDNPKNRDDDKNPDQVKENTGKKPFSSGGQSTSR